MHLKKSEKKTPRIVVGFSQIKTFEQLKLEADAQGIPSGELLKKILRQEPKRAQS